MSTDLHTPIVSGSPRSSASVNTPLAALDDAIGLYGARVIIRASGGDDSSAINAAIAAATGPLVLVFPDASYQLDDPVLVDKDDVTLQGLASAINPTTNPTTFVAGGSMSGAMIVVDKEPGLSPQGEASPQYVLGGFTMRDILLDGDSQASTDGVSLVTVRSATLERCSFTGITGKSIETANHGTAPGGDDAYDQNTFVRLSNVNIITSTGTGVYLDGNTYGVSIRGLAITITGAGVGVDLLGVDDVWVDGYQLYSVDAGGINIRLNGADFGGKAATAVVFGPGGYSLGAGTHLRSTGDGFDITPQRCLFLGVGTEDIGDWTINADKGAMPSYSDLDGRHNWRHYLKRSAHAYDDFISGGAGNSTTGQLGWSTDGSSPGWVNSAANHPGIVQITSTASSGTLHFLALRTSGSGLVLPADEFIAEFIFRANVEADAIYRIGLMDDPASDPPANGIYIEKLAGDSDWYPVTRASSSETRGAAIADFTAAGWERLTLRRHNSTTIGINLGDSINSNDDARHTTNVPTASLIPAFQVKNNAAAAKTLDIDAFQLLVKNLSR